MKVMRTINTLVIASLLGAVAYAAAPMITDFDVHRANAQTQSNFICEQVNLSNYTTQPGLPPGFALNNVGLNDSNGDGLYDEVIFWTNNPGLRALLARDINGNGLDAGDFVEGVGSSYTATPFDGGIAIRGLPGMTLDQFLTSPLYIALGNQSVSGQWTLWQDSITPSSNYSWAQLFAADTSGIALQDPCVQPQALTVLYLPLTMNRFNALVPRAITKDIRDLGHYSWARFRGDLNGDGTQENFAGVSLNTAPLASDAQLFAAVDENRNGVYDQGENVLTMGQRLSTLMGWTPAQEQAFNQSLVDRYGINAGIMQGSFFVYTVPANFPMNPTMNDFLNLFGLPLNDQNALLVGTMDQFVRSPGGSLESAVVKGEAPLNLVVYQLPGVGGFTPVDYREQIAAAFGLTAAALGLSLVGKGKLSKSPDGEGDSPDDPEDYLRMLQGHPGFKPRENMQRMLDSGYVNGAFAYASGRNITDSQAQRAVRNALDPKMNRKGVTEKQAAAMIANIALYSGVEPAYELMTRYGIDGSLVSKEIVNASQIQGAFYQVDYFETLNALEAKLNAAPIVQVPKEEMPAYIGAERQIEAGGLTVPQALFVSAALYGRQREPARL